MPQIKERIARKALLEATYWPYDTLSSKTGTSELKKLTDIKIPGSAAEHFSGITLTHSLMGEKRDSKYLRFLEICCIISLHNLHFSSALERIIAAICTTSIGGKAIAFLVCWIRMVIGNGSQNAKRVAA